MEPTKQSTPKEQAMHSAGAVRYSSFLLVMLILSSIVTAFLALSAIGTMADMASGSDSLRNLVGVSIERNVFYWLTSLISLVIGFGSIAALALLWMKNKAGIILKFSLLGLTFLNMLIALGVTQRTNFRSYLRSGSEYHNGVVVYNSGTFAAIFIFIGAIFLCGIATLWYFAWKAQQKHDGKSKFLA